MDRLEIRQGSCDSAAYKSELNLRFAESEDDINQFWHLFDEYIAELAQPGTFGARMSGEELEWFFSSQYRDRIIELFRRETDPLRIVFIEYSGQTIGFGTYVIYLSEDAKCYILEFGIEPEFRSRGIGNHAWAVLERLLCDAGGAYAHLTPGSAASAAFWRKCGFSETDIIGDNGTCYFMKRFAVSEKAGPDNGDVRLAAQNGGMKMGELQIKPIEYASEAYRSELILRDTILRKPLGLDLFSEDLSGEERDIHLGIFEGEDLIGVLVLTHVDAQRVRMRQVAVEEKRQHCGIGASLVAAAERLAHEQGYEWMTLHARETAAGFYEKLGYATEGDPFVEVGIPHRAMVKLI